MRFPPFRGRPGRAVRQRRPLRPLLVALGGVLLALPALVVRPASAAAQETTTPPPPPPKPKRLEFSGAIGYVAASGNADVTTITGNDKLTWRAGKVTVVQQFNVVYGTIGDSVNANLWSAGLRVDRSLGPRVTVYVTTGVDRNTLAGIARRFEEGLGLSVQLLTATRDKLTLEGGAGIVQQYAVSGPMDRSFSAARFAASYRHDFTSAAYFTQTLEQLPNLNDPVDLRVNAESGVVAPVSRRIGVKLTYTVRYDRLPAAGKQTTDRLFSTGIQLTF